MMGRVKPRVPDCDHKNNLQNTGKDYITPDELSICSAAYTYGIPYGTLYDWPQCAQPWVEAHESEQIPWVEEEKSIVMFCEALDNLDHSWNGKLLKELVMILLPSGRWWQFGKHCSTQVLNVYFCIALKFS